MRLEPAVLAAVAALAAGPAHADGLNDLPTAEELAASHAADVAAATANIEAELATPSTAWPPLINAPVSFPVEEPSEPLIYRDCPACGLG